MTTKPIGDSAVAVASKFAFEIWRMVYDAIEFCERKRLELGPEESYAYKHTGLFIVSPLFEQEVLSLQPTSNLSPVLIEIEKARSAPFMFRGSPYPSATQFLVDLLIAITPEKFPTAQVASHPLVVALGGEGITTIKQPTYVIAPYDPRLDELLAIRAELNSEFEQLQQTFSPTGEQRQTELRTTDRAAEDARNNKSEAGTEPILQANQNDPTSSPDGPFPNGPFDADGFRFKGVEVRFGRAAKQVRLVASLWDAEKCQISEARDIQAVIEEVYGRDNDTSDNTFRQLCSDTRKKLEASNFPLSIYMLNGKVVMRPVSS